MLHKLEQRLKEHQISNVQTILGGIGQELLPKQTFDRAILVTVLGEIPEQSQALPEIYEALKPNGTCKRCPYFFFSAHFGEALLRQENGVLYSREESKAN